MKVILLEKYRRLGEVGDIVEVKSGYARNYLIPNEKAVQATKGNIADFESKKTELLKQSAENEKLAKKEAGKIENKIITIVKQAGDDGRLYGSVTTSEIAEGINKVVDVKLTRKEVTLNSAIKFLGFYQAHIELDEGVTTSVYANIARTESEAKEIEEKFNKGKISLGPISSNEEEQRENFRHDISAAANDRNPDQEETADDEGGNISAEAS